MTLFAYANKHAHVFTLKTTGNPHNFHLTFLFLYVLYILLHIFDSKVTLKVIKMNFIALDSQHIKSSELEPKQATQAFLRTMKDFASYLNFYMLYFSNFKAVMYRIAGN